ncbi:AMP-binding protein [Emcibacter nanhaiensis]|uniref:Long-chain fatty acid--CoA ligase n=1 Tax=Emcibacter nanhaiensis TaxID=1505037 RepID=A0A501PI31_9PROT|nr:AMP-binding protein [Emcibacter nanhaiensis]TPD60143.1 long-chain fatty acid--CoA ligase [Emcibacter nanhaiensis]
MNIFSLLTLGTSRYKNEGAIFHGTRQVCSWAELSDRSLRLAAHMHDNTPPGGRVAVVAKNCPQYIEIMFASWAAGRVVVPINAKLHSREINDIISDAEAALVFATPAEAAKLEGVDCPVTIIGSPEYEEMFAGDPTPPAEVAPDDLAWLFFTSGTTGRSKGAMLSHRNLMAMTISHLADFEALTENDGIIHSAPMSHGSGLYILPYVARAARQIVPESGGFEPEEVLDLCEHHRNIGMFLAPTMVQRLRLTLEKTGRHPEGLRNIVYGGGPMYLEEIRQSLDVFGPVFCQLYGQGEAPMTITGLRPGDFADGDDAVLSSVGWPRSGMEVAIFDNNDQPLPPGETGEIVCRGDVVMSGYWNNPTATESTLAGGWLHTGDLGSLDEDGKLTLRGRSKEVIISGGTNIYPREVEEVLLTCPGVSEACVVGEKDPDWGENVVAFITWQENATPDEKLLETHCLENMARFKRPKRYIFLDDFPKSANGKVLKRELENLL